MKKCSVIRKLIIFAGIIFANLLINQSFASHLQKDSAFQLGLSLGYGLQEDPFISDDDENFYYQIDISYYGDNFFFDNGDLGTYLFTNNNLSLNLVATVKNERDLFQPISHLTRGLNISGASRSLTLDEFGASPTQNPNQIIFNIPSRDTSINGGIEVVFENSLGIFHSQWVKDISSTHEGNIFWASYSDEYGFSKSVFSYSLGVSHKSKDYVGYYFGLFPSEANQVLDSYSGKNTTNTFLKLAYSHSLSDDFYFNTFVVFERLGSGISQSPIVNKNSISTFFSGFYYRFF